LRVCVPSSGTGGLEDEVGEHFGRVPTYTILNTQSGEVEIIDNDSQHRGGSGLPAELLAEEGVDLVICSALGRKAMELLDREGIEVCTGASGSVEEAIEDWREDQLVSGSETDPCDRHQFRGKKG